MQKTGTLFPNNLKQRSGKIKSQIYKDDINFLKSTTYKLYH